MKKRLDQILVDRKLVDTKTKAQALIMSGQVIVDGKVSDKAGKPTADDVEISLKDAFLYVSRGALKLEKAYTEFDLEFEGKIVCDIGSSTGGFTDFALQKGAKKVYAVDVGTGQLAQKIREDKRVVVMEKTDFRDVLFQPSHSFVISTEAEKSVERRSLGVARDDKINRIPEPIDMFVCDVSFISLKKIIPKIASFLSSSASQIKSDKLAGEQDSRLRGDDKWRGGNDVGVTDIILLIKPQFEAGVKEVTKGKGVIRDENVRQEIVSEIKNFALDQGFDVKGLVESPITGAKGNVEYLLLLTHSH